MPLNPEAEVFLGKSDTGSAVVIRPDAETAIDYYSRLQLQQQRGKFDAQSEALRKLDTIKAWSIDQPYFQQKRKGYREKIVQAMKGKYTQDPEYVGSVNEEQDMIIAQAAKSNETKANYDYHKKKIEDHPELYSENALEELDKYAKTPLEERDPTWTLPQLRDADYMGHFRKNKGPHYKAGEKIINPDGTGYTTFTDTYKEKEGLEEALKEVSNPDDRYARGLKKSLAMGKHPGEEGAIPGFEYLPFAEQERILNSPEMNNAAAIFVNESRKKLFAGTDKRTIDMQPSETTGFGGSGEGSNDRFNVTKVQPGTVRETFNRPIEGAEGFFSGAPVRKVARQIEDGYDITQITSTTENPTQYWKASYVYSPDGKKQSTNFYEKGVLLGVYKYDNIPEYVAEIKIPAHKEEKTVKGLLGTSKKETVEIPEHTVQIPYPQTSKAIQSYTTGKKNKSGWLLPGFKGEAAQPATQKQAQASPPSQGTSTTPDDIIINSTLDFEEKNGYSNYGFTGHSGKLTKEQALEKAKKEYLPMVKNLPAPLKAVAFDFAFNSEDPRASLMVAAGVQTPENKKGLYKNGKLDKAEVDRRWKLTGEFAVLNMYNRNPKEFLDAFDKERKRSYDNTKGADEKGNEWYERVAVSRKVADKLLNQSSAATKKGDKKQFKEGMATFNGTKWVLD